MCSVLSHATRTWPRNLKFGIQSNETFTKEILFHVNVLALFYESKLTKQCPIRRVGRFSSFCRCIANSQCITLRLPRQSHSEQI